MRPLQTSFIGILLICFISGCASNSKKVNSTRSPAGITETGEAKTSSKNYYLYLDALRLNSNYLNSRAECYFKNKNEFSEFAYSNVILVDRNAKNASKLINSQKLLTKNDWASYSWHLNSVNECIKNLNTTLSKMPAQIKNIYVVMQAAENNLAEELRLRRINVGKYNEVRYLLSIEEQADINKILNDFKSRAELEEANNKKIEVQNAPTQNLQRSNKSKDSSDLGNAAFVTLACALLTGGKSAECAAGATSGIAEKRENDSTDDLRLLRQQRQLREQQRQIDDLKLQQTLDRMRQQQKDLNREFERDRIERDKWRPGQRQY